MSISIPIISIDEGIFFFFFYLMRNNMFFETTQPHSSCLQTFIEAFWDILGLTPCIYIMVLQATHSRANELGLGENTSGSGDAEPTSCGLGAAKMHVSMGGFVHLY